MLAFQNNVISENQNNLKCVFWQLSVLNPLTDLLLHVILEPALHIFTPKLPSHEPPAIMSSSNAISEDAIVELFSSIAVFYT